MAVQWIGNQLAELLEDFPQEIRLDGYGVAGGALYYSCLYDQALTLVQNITVHPTFTYLKRTRGVIKREESNLGKVVLDFEGVPPSTDQRDYRLSGSTSTEPIESHPNFKNKIGGIPNARLNNAIFNTDGTFKGFPVWATAGNVGQNAAPASGNSPTSNIPPSGSVLNPKAGVKSYLSGSLIYEETHTRGNSSATNDVSALGYIDLPPPSDVFPYGLASGRTWLMINAEIGQVGFGTKLVRRWRLSGLRGWDTDIYTHNYS